MLLSDILKILGPAGGGIIILLLALIKVEPLKISVWSWLARKIGKAFAGETLDRVANLEREVTQVRKIQDEMEEKEKLKEAISARRRILRFSDEMYANVYHSREHFETIMNDDIKYYRDYCDENKEFRNDQATTAINRIISQYDECMKRHSFDDQE